MYLLFEDARKVVREMGLKNKKEWDNWIRGKSKIYNIPSNPNVYYKNDRFRIFTKYVIQITTYSKNRIAQFLEKLWIYICLVSDLRTPINIKSFLAGFLLTNSNNNALFVNNNICFKSSF